MKIKVFTPMILLVVLSAMLPLPLSAQSQSAQNVELVGQIGGVTYAVVVQGSYAYVGVGPRLIILDISDPAGPAVVGRSGVLPAVVQSVAVAGNYAYVATDTAGLRIIDISDPANPTEIGSYATSREIRDIAVADNYAYVAEGVWFHIIDISDPTHPTLVGFYSTPGWARGVAVAGSYAYVAEESDTSGLRIIDVSNPASPTQAGFYRTPGRAQDVTVAGNYAYVADGNTGLRIIDISDPASPTEIGSYDTPGHAYGVSVTGNYALVADGYSGLRIIDVSDPASSTEVGFYDTTGVARDVAVTGNYAYIADLNAGLRIIDVSAPPSATEVGSYDTLGQAWDVAVAGNYAYVATWDRGLRIMDITDPANPTEISFYDTPGRANAVAVVGNYAYVADGDTGLRIIYISDPAHPAEIDFYDTPRYAKDVAVAGNYAYVADDTSGLRIIDISDPANPTEVGFYDTPGFADAVTVEGNYAYVADVGGLRIIDIFDPIHPTEIGFYDTLGGAVDVAVAGNYAYVAADTAGLRIIDVSDPANPTEIGIFNFSNPPGSAQDVAVADNYAYIAYGDMGLRVIEVSNPARPGQSGFYATPGFARSVVVAGSYAYVADYHGGLAILRFVETSTPTPTFTPATTATATATPTSTPTLTPIPPTITPTPTPTPTFTWTPTPTNTPTPTATWTATATPTPTATNSPTPIPTSTTGYEPNDTCDQARPITTDGTEQHHQFQSPGDVDWVYFNATAHTSYYIEARVPDSSPADVVMQVFDACGGAATPHDSFSPDVRIQFDAPQDGPVYLQLTNNDPDEAGSDVTYSLSVRTLSASAQPGALVLVAGRLRANDRVQGNIHRVTNNVYNLFLGQGYPPDRIYYLATDINLDPDGNPATQDVDALTSRDQLRYAITQWATDPQLDLGPDRAFTLYMMDHGNYDRFYLNGRAQTVGPDELNDWLDILEAARPGVRVNVIYEACFSGSFIDPDKTLSKPGRVIITSTGNRTSAYASPEGGAIFSDVFLQALGQGMSLYSAFQRAQSAARSWHRDQVAWLDDTGDGYATAEDGREAQRRGFAYTGTFPDRPEPPYIAWVRGPDAIENRRGAIEAQVRDDVPGAKLAVWAVVYGPDYAPPTATEELVVEEGLPTVRLEDGNGDGIYTGVYAGFDQVGDYRIVVYATDEDGLVGRPREVTVRTGWRVFIPAVTR